MMTKTLPRNLCSSIAATLLALATAATVTGQAKPPTPTPPPTPLTPAPEPLPALQGRPDLPEEEMLGGTFQNPLAGIAFRVPVNCVQIKATGDEIARFTNEKAGWEIVCTRNSSAQPMPLTGGDPREYREKYARWQQAADEAKRQKRPFSEKPPQPKQAGLLEVVGVQLVNRNPGAEIVRQDVEDLGENKAGIIAARLSAVGQRKLFQQAIIQANDQLYYTISMTSPASKDAKGPDSDDVNERIAAESFRQMLDTVKLLDRSVVKEDQNQRLFRTRALFVNFTPKTLRDTLIPEQWMRLIHDGKDIGYTYIVEEAEKVGPREGIKIGIRSRSYPDASTQVDAETWYIVSSDRRHENWSNLVWIQDRKTKQSEQITEIGSSDRLSGVQLETYELNVQTRAKSATAEPVKRSLPPFYIPQAIGHLLPRLLPLREPKTYLFATYVADRREVMMRYVDVGSEQQADLGGERVRAVPVTDRIGLEGSATIHYLDPASGRYLGSVNKDSKITILPTDKETLQKKWSNADLSRPAPAAPHTPREDPEPVSGTSVGGEAVKQ